MSRIWQEAARRPHRAPWRPFASWAARRLRSRPGRRQAALASRLDRAAIAELDELRGALARVTAERDGWKAIARGLMPGVRPGPWTDAGRRRA